MAATSDGGALLARRADGGVFAFGDAGSLRQCRNPEAHQAGRRMAATADGRGYWLVASDGGVFSYGDARFQGSMGPST